MKWYGGKTKIASRICELMPPHKHYVEPFAGGLAVLLRKPLGASEVVNDVLTHLTTFWRVLRDDPKLIEMLRLTPVGETVLHEAQQRIGKESDLVTAWAMYVIMRQSFAAAGKAFVLTKRVREGVNDLSSAWINSIEALPQIVQRLHSVVIVNRDALKLIPDQDTPDTLFYCDPPYPASTRVQKTAYTHEMSTAQHTSLLCILKRCVGKVMVSGYNHAAYNYAFRDWNRHTFRLPNHAAKRETKEIKEEIVWTNF